MGLWGTAHASADNKPKYLPEDENSKYTKGNAFANQSGWVMQAGTAASGNDNTSATPEVLVAIGGLAGASASTGLRAPNVTDMRFIVGSTATTDLTAGSSAQTITVEITYDEQVTVVGSPTVAVANGNEGTGTGRGPYTLVYTATGSTANRLRFTLASQTIVANDVLTLGGSNIALAGGTISDTVVGGTTLAASLVLSGLTAVTHTVLA
tara:strand:+ start:651 stop:1277 length:627 start_codon:yes stop_codon:yes gene_type:complete